ncbi:MAG: NAD-dependent DNA ligase LigA [Holosporaceae bacterium]|nr:NAD-dependent DNA ligase LigA [Holosporaceae bacterium]
MVEEFLLMDKEKRYRELIKLLKEYSNQYYLWDSPTISDATYDELYNELLALEKEFPQLKIDNSPSQTVGAKVARSFTRITHLYPMLSLENAYNEDDISTFLERVRNVSQRRQVDLVLEPKLDGLSASLTYKNGLLVRGATRGDGVVGEDVTKNIMTISDVPKRIVDDSLPEEMEIRGEVVMRKDEFQKLNESRAKSSEKLFANPRNAASGSLRQSDAEITRSRKLTFFAYSIMTKQQVFKTQMDVLHALARYGFSISDKISLCRDQQEAFLFYSKMEHQRAELDYDIDGVVYKVNDLQLQQEMGTSSKFPKHSIAYKFSAEKAETTVTDIIVQVGRTGNITPVAELKPITVGGVVITKATLHNRDEIERKDIRVGDRVVLQRAGDVIPQILYPILEKRPPNTAPFKFPDICPCCGSQLATCGEEVAVKCLNINCEAQVIEKLIHFASKQAFDIGGLGNQNMRFLFESGFVKSPLDIFELESKNSQIKLENMEGWGKLSAENLFASIRNARTISLDRFIYALGIPQVGQVASKQLASFFGSCTKLLNAAQNKELDGLLMIDWIGQATLHGIKNFFLSKDNMEFIEKLVQIVDVQDMEAGSFEDAPLANRTIVFTGTFDDISREEAKELAEKFGAKTSSSVSAKTSFVVAGENAGKKLDQAKKLGIPILSKYDFMKIIENNS